MKKNSEGRRILRAGGFSLLEVLVVLVIISIILTFMPMSFDTDSEKLVNEGERLVALMKLASEEAIMNSREYRVVFTANKYSFEKLGDGEWAEFADGVFRGRELPDDFRFDLTLGNEPVKLVVDNEDDPKKQAAILFLSSGEITPFEVVVKSDSGKKIVVNNQSGEIAEDTDRR
jgi:general secretion pathway protein H